jgi:hypothetical protein
MDPRRACSNPRNDARLFYFAAAVPMVGFMHGAADLNPIDGAAPDGNVEITDRRRGRFPAPPRLLARRMI